MAIPKHAQIFQELHREIRRGKLAPGSRLSSETALGARFGASRPTVARALAELQRMGLLERFRGSGSYVRALRTAKGVLGLVTDGLSATEIALPLAAEISRAAQRKGWSVATGEPLGDRSPESVAREWTERGVKGVFFASIEHHPVRAAANRAITEAMTRAGLAVVLLDRDLKEFPERSGLDLVAIDDFFAGFDLARHVLDGGAGRLVFLARKAYPATTDLRLAGAREAVARVERAEIAFAVGEPEDRGWVRTLLSSNRPKAIIASNDATAAALLATLRALGVAVPTELKVAGFDDVRFARSLKPPLTTMRQPVAAIGAAAFETMLGRLREPDMPARRVLLRAQLVSRASTCF